MGKDLLPVLTDNGSYVYVDINSMSLSELISLRDYVTGNDSYSVSVIDAVIGRIIGSDGGCPHKEYKHKNMALKQRKKMEKKVIHRRRRKNEY